MPTLELRDLPDSTFVVLRDRAARNGRSIEAEAGTILSAACAPEDRTTAASTLPGWVAQLYGGNRPRAVVEDLIRERCGER
jgi:antitoxin FitA-like protein